MLNLSSGLLIAITLSLELDMMSPISGSAGVVTAGPSGRREV
jgi:hypothetical protein